MNNLQQTIKINDNNNNKIGTTHKMKAKKRKSFGYLISANTV